jgi:broad specificity phosphatase PhoE
MPGVALSERGERQAVRLGERLASEPIDGVLCSPLDRTRATAEAIAAVRRAPVTTDEGLMELEMGEWTGREIEGLHGEAAWIEWNQRRATARIPGGETMAEAQARIVGSLTRLAAENPGKVAVVTHADMIKAAVAHVLELSLDNIGRFDVGPASVTRMVWGSWGARLMSLNETLC